MNRPLQPASSPAAQPCTHVAILIPARDEEELLPRCLHSVELARLVLPPHLTTDVVVIVDSSTDRTLSIAQGMLQSRGAVRSASLRNVGRARALAAAVALRRSPAPPHLCWLANTDADCIVPRTWLERQLHLASAGFAAIAGTVNVDSFHEHAPEVQQRFRESYLIHADGTHPHVHGANLGIRADAYLRAGGWAPLVTAEDHALWNRLPSAGVRRLSDSRMEVLTSGRRVARAPHGFAAALAAHNPYTPNPTLS